MTKAELVQALQLVPDEYTVHIEGQEISAIELHVRTQSIIRRDPARDDASDLHPYVAIERKVDGVANLVAIQENEG